LARQDISVIGVDANLKQATAHTRLCRKVACADFRGAGLLQCLLDLGRTLPAKGVLFPSGDISLDLVSEQRDVLREYFEFILPDQEVMRLVLNKKTFYHFAKQHGFLIPTTYFPRDEQEVAEFLSWRRSLDAVPLLVELRRRGDDIRRQELEKARKRLGPLTPEQEQALEVATSAIVSKLLHPPTVLLKELARNGDHTAEVGFIRRLLGL
jgi:hypothetical protein